MVSHHTVLLGSAMLSTLFSLVWAGLLWTAADKMEEDIPGFTFAYTWTALLAIVVSMSTLVFTFKKLTEISYGLVSMSSALMMVNCITVFAEFQDLRSDGGVLDDDRGKKYQIAQAVQAFSWLVLLFLGVFIGLLVLYKGNILGDIVKPNMTEEQRQSHEVRMPEPVEDDEAEQPEMAVSNSVQE